MDTTLLKHLGVHERVVQALQKSSGGRFEAVEIEQSAAGLRLIVRYREADQSRAHIITLTDLPENSPSSVCSEPQAEYTAGNISACRCKDTITFLSPRDAGQPNLRINGQKLRMGDSLFRLLHHLAVQMKKDNIGWIAMQDLREARLIPKEGYQIFSRLRSVVAGYLLAKNPRDFIEANGCKQYRLSVPPENIILIPDKR